jgi:hypothetical protein
MNNKYVTLCFGLALLLSACIPSVNPFYSDKDIVFDPRLVGSWHDKDEANESQVWQFEKADDRSYKLTITEKEGKQGEFGARLFKLRDEYFLDLVPTECDFATNQADIVAGAMIPGHLIVRVPQRGPELKLAFFDFDWLAKHLEKHPRSLAHHREGDRVLLTAKTRELQRFVLKHLAPGTLFEEPAVFVPAPRSAE